MTAQVLFFDVFSEKDPHLNAIEFFITLYKAFLKNKKISGTSLPASFPVWFLKKNISYVVFYDLTKLNCLIAFTSWDNW